MGGLVVVEAGDLFEPGAGDDLALLSPFIWGVVTYGSPTAAITAGVTSDVGDFTEVSDDKLLLVGGELEVWRRGPAWDRTGIRLIAESYLNWPFGGASAFDPSVTAAGFRLVDGALALEVVTVFTAQGGDIDFADLPLLHFSVLF